MENKKIKRKSGFYWVIQKQSNIWLVAEYFAFFWILGNSNEKYADKDFMVINEKRIPKPRKKLFDIIKQKRIIIKDSCGKQYAYLDKKGLHYTKRN